MPADATDNKRAIEALFNASNQHGRDIAVLHQENAELKAGQNRLQNTMADHGELLHAIKADLGNNRFPGVVPIAQMTVYVGTIIAMLVGGISYISSNLSSAQLTPRLAGLEQKNVTIEHQLKRDAPTIKRIARMESSQTLFEYRLAQLEKRPSLRNLMFRSRFKQ